MSVYELIGASVTHKAGVGHPFTRGHRYNRHCALNVSLEQVRDWRISSSGATRNPGDLQLCSMNVMDHTHQDGQAVEISMKWWR